MKTSLDCIPCFIRQTLDAARHNSDDPEFHKMVLKKILAQTAGMDMNQAPPEMAQYIHRQLRLISGIEDPYRDIKAQMNRIAMSILPTLRDEINNAADPLFSAVRYCITGNVIDMGAYSSLSQSDVLQAVNETYQLPLAGDYPAFKKALLKAENILYIADNAGEIAFDRLLIEQLQTKNITVAVRGAPVLNDCTRADAATVGLDQMVNIIDNGTDIPGTVLSECSAEFLSYYKNADLIISKGQGNFESLSDENKNIWFLFKVKCPVIAREANQPVGSLMLLQT
jgi:damage-control phosphatase, subfamily I